MAYYVSMKTPTKRVHRTITLSEWGNESAEELAAARGLKLSAILEWLVREEVKREQKRRGEP
jgi:hypothetical protein